MIVAPDNRQEIRPLTGIRGFAAGLVLFTHFFPVWSMLLPSMGFLRLLTGRGFLGVDLFFVLSGFILSYVYFDAAKPGLTVKAYRVFVWHRFVRVWPVHAATLGLLFLAVLAAHFLSLPFTGRYPFSALPFQFTMTHAWLCIPVAQSADPLGAWTWNYPSWSISAEWFAYLLVFPVLWPVLKCLNGRGGCSFLLCYAVMAVWALILLPLDFHWGRAIVVVAFEFTAGALLYNVFRSGSVVTKRCQQIATPTFVVIVAALLACPVSTPLFPSFLILLFPILLLGLTAETALVARFFASPPALWLGRVSFSVYMTQAITQKALKLIAAPEKYVHSPLAGRLAYVACSLVFILAFASAFYYGVETPARYYLRRLEKGRGGR